MRASTSDSEGAQRIGIEALGFLAEHPEILERFLKLSGFEAHDLRAAAGEPFFFANLLDFILADETTLLSFAGHAARDPAAIAIARRALGGSEA